MKMNKKGFTMVELLGAIIIMGILMLIAGGAVLVYLDKSKENSYQTMAISARQGAEQYVMEFPAIAMSKDEYKEFERNPDISNSKVITFEELTEEQMISKPQDPADTTQTCTGRVIVILNEADANNERELDSYSYVVHQCCAQKKAKYTFSEKYVKKGTNTECNPSTDDDCELIESNGEEYAGVLCD